MLYTELIIGLVKVILYGLFIVIMVRIYTLPLFAVRPMYLTARAFKKAFNDVILSRRAIHNMNTWYPDATPEELENLEATQAKFKLIQPAVIRYTHHDDSKY